MVKKNYANQKGADYEYKLAQKISKYWGAKAYRTPESGALHKEAGFQLEGDIVVDSRANFPFVIEAKKREDIDLSLSLLNKGTLKNYYQEVIDDAYRVNKTPLLIFSKNYKPDMVWLPYRKKLFAKLVENGDLAVAMNVVIHDKVFDRDIGYLIIMTTLEGFMGVDKQFYADNYTYDNWDWKQTVITYTDKEDLSEKGVKEQASTILDLMFGDLEEDNE